MTTTAMVGSQSREALAQTAISAYRTGRLGRAAGTTALLALAIFVLSILQGTGSVLHGQTDSATALAFAGQHGPALVQLGFMDGTLNTLFGVLIALLVVVGGGDRLLASIAYVSAGAAAAIQWTHAGILYALADLAHRGGADAGVLALFTLDSTMDEADGIVIPIALVCAAWLLLRSGRTPAVVPWLTMATAAVGAAVAVLAGMGGPDLGPVAVISSWIWLFGIGITLVIKPVSALQARTTAEGA